MKRLRLLTVLLLSLLLVGCMTQKRCERIALRCGTEKTVTVVKDTTIYIDKNILVKLPGDTVKITQQMQVYNDTVSMAPVTFKDGLITATAWIARGNKLNVFAWLNQKELTIRHRDTIYIDKYRTTESKTVTVTQKVVPKVYKTAAIIVAVELVLLLLYVLIKLKPGIFGAVMSFISKK